ncbi:hypothetical protein OPW19_20905 [Vibrio europaeus]|uniref:protein kinase domain-containing protein n=1 Tax=Vibrio europaeus TaxID=300876 RepID=UPI00233EE915|nr:hypothetical protein [Vibrio europaeus]MDC5822279.1 hypothetical protein [Vibrio europaeus]MDC5870445.1 hypothetical protein [Vibrio europaeus]
MPMERAINQGRVFVNRNALRVPAGHQTRYCYEAPHEYIKQFTAPAELAREYSALIDCQGACVQEVLGVDWSHGILRLSYDPCAVTLSQFTSADLPTFIAILPRIISAIEHCHQRGWVHGDIKPSNLLYVPKNHQVRLIDFGASHRMGTRRETFRHWQGTPMFASSAQLNGEGRVEARDDWYSLNKIIEQVMPLERDYTRRTELERLSQRLCTRISDRKVYEKEKACDRES